MDTVEYKLLDFLESGNSLCESFDMDSVTASKVKQNYKSIKEFEEFPLISAARLGYHRLVWGYITYVRMTNKDLHTDQTLDLQKFLGYSDSSTGQTALHEAAWFGHFEVVKILLQYVSEEHLISYRNINGCTPLSWLKDDPKYDILIFATLKAAGKVDPFFSIHKGTMASKMHKSGEASITPTMKAIEVYKEVDMAAASYPTSHKHESQFALDNLNDGKCELTPHRNTILHLVSKLGDIGYTKSILEKHPSLIENRNSEGETPLYVAARDGKMDILEILINHVKDDDNLKLELAIRNKDNHTALHIAIVNHHAGVVFLLVKEIPKLANCINCFNESPLNLAVEKNYYQIFKLILDECTEKAFGGTNGSTALHTAVELAPECIQDLLREKNDLPRIYNRSGWTPLHYAVFYDKVDATIALLKADHISGYQMTNITNGENYSAIHIAVGQGHQKQIEALFSYCPGCLEMTDSKERNILHVAIKEKKKETFSFILQSYNSVTTDLLFQKDGDGNTPYDLLKDSSYEEYLVIVNRSSDNLYARGDKFITSAEKARNDIFLTAKERARNGNFLSTKEKARNNITLTPIEKAKQEEEENRKRQLEEDEKRIQEQKEMDEKRQEEEKKQQEKEQKQKEEEEKQKQKVNKMGDNVVLVITLIATATFAAAFTVPGGFDGNEDSSTQGMPILLRKALYKTFVISNALAFSCSCCVLFAYVRLQLYNLSYEKLKDEDKKGYNNIINLQYLLTGIAMTTMTVAFITGTYVILTPSLALAISLCATCVCIIVPFSLFPAKYFGFATRIVSIFDKA